MTHRRGGQSGNQNAAKPVEEKNTKRWHVDMPQELYNRFQERAGKGNMATVMRELIKTWCDTPPA